MRPLVLLHCVAGILLLVCERTFAADAAESDAGLSQQGPAAALVRAAYESEMRGDAQQRAALLRAALEQDSDYAPARWQLGYVKSGDRWLTADEFVNACRTDAHLAEYLRQRDVLVGALPGETALARWCGDHELPEQARFHWFRVLALQAQHDEALRNLDMQWYRGGLVPRDEIAQLKRRDYQAARNPFHVSPAQQRLWERKLAGWLRAARHGTQDVQLLIEQDWTTGGDDHLVAYVNYLIGQQSRVSKEAESLRRVGLGWVKFLGGERPNAKYLVMQAIGNPSADVRAAAADELQPLRREDYVPLLLSCARYPIEVSCSLLAWSGYASFHVTMDIQGQEVDLRRQHTTLGSYLTPPDPVARDTERGRAGQGRVAAAAATHRALHHAVGLARQVTDYRQFAEETNRRVADALMRGTGEEFKDDPRQWQTWWKQYLCDSFELDPDPGSGNRQGGGQWPEGAQEAGRQSSAGQQDPRPIIQVSSHVSQIVAFNAYHSCFAAGTPVWTETGPCPIDEIRPGDRVLSQHAATGELAYKLVLETTKADPAPMIALTVEGQEIVTTRGHPFREVGKGWTMAKHLRQGSLLHTVDGPVVLEATREVPVAREWYAFSYNLIVDDFHTYFVGEPRILVHHLTYLSIVEEGSANVPGY